MPPAVVSPAPPPPDLLGPVEVARLGGLELVTEGIVEGFLAGLHRSPRRGFFVEFAEHRMYQPGDELRYLDWRLLAAAAPRGGGPWAGGPRLYENGWGGETIGGGLWLPAPSRSMDWSGAPESRLT